jgi:hypothetical protein
MTRKLTLVPESLSVESFESDTAADVRGTVEAHDGKVPCVLSANPPISCPYTVWDCHGGEKPE